jgi:hypothetical protein
MQKDVFTLVRLLSRMDAGARRSAIEYLQNAAQNPTLRAAPQDDPQLE